MPSRYIREGWIDSSRIDSLDAKTEAFFLRLCLKADDFGRYTANPVALKNTLYPLKDDVRATDSARMLAACERAGLVRCYMTIKGPTLEIRDFNQRSRAKESKYPPPDEALSDKRPADDGHKSALFENENENEVDVATTQPAPLSWSIAKGWEGVTEEHQKEWEKAYPACDIPRQLADMGQWLKSNPAKAQKSNWLKFITTWLRKSQDRGGDIPSLPLARQYQPRAKADHAC